MEQDFFPHLSISPSGSLLSLCRLKKKILSFYLLSSSSWADNLTKRERLTGENGLFIMDVHAWGITRYETQTSWAVEVSMPLWTKKEGGRGLRFRKKSAIYRWPRKSGTHIAGKFLLGNLETTRHRKRS